MVYSCVRFPYPNPEQCTKRTITFPAIGSHIAEMWQYGTPSSPSVVFIAGTFAHSSYCHFIIFPPWEKCNYSDSAKSKISHCAFQAESELKRLAHSEVPESREGKGALVMKVKQTLIGQLKTLLFNNTSDIGGGEQVRTLFNKFHEDIFKVGEKKNR